MRSAAYVVMAGLWALCGAAAPAQEKVIWKYSPNQEIKYRMVQDMDMETTVGELPQKTQVKQSMDIRWIVKNVDDKGGAEVSQVVDRVQQAITGGPLGSIKFDSAAAPENDEGALASQMRTMFANLIGKPTHMHMSSLGEVSDVQLPEGFGQGDIPMTREAMESLVGNSALAFPSDSMKPGDTWNREVKMPLPQIGEMKVNSVYEFKGVENGVGTILVTPKIQVEAPGDVKFKLAAGVQDSTGTIRFDVKQGNILSSDIAQNFAFEIEVQGQRVKQSIKQTVKMTRVEAP